MLYRLAVLIIALLFSACGARPSSPPLPTARFVSPTPRRSPTARAASPAPASPTPAPPPPTTTPATSLDQYRAWMAEARALHPYDEPLETMWAVMICESSGNPELVADAYHGLFQYASETWAGDWNPYRDQPILDPRAQIFATAKAWHDGNQHWWGCYR